MVGIIIAIIATLVIAVPVSAYVANTRSKKAMEITIGNAEDKAREIIDEAIKAADAKKREASLEVKEETIKASNWIYSPFFFLYKYGRMDCCNFSSVSIISCVRCFTLSSAAGYWFK